MKMTNEDAIKVLQTYDMSEDNDDDEFKSAVTLAIHVLAKEETLLELLTDTIPSDPNKLRVQADALQYEIESALDNDYQISTNSATDTYGMDGHCPMYQWGTELFDIQQIRDVIAFKEAFYKENGENPDRDTISRHFATEKF